MYWLSLYPLTFAHKILVDISKSPVPLPSRVVLLVAVVEDPSSNVIVTDDEDAVYVKEMYLSCSPSSMVFWLNGPVRPIPDSSNGGP